METLALIVSAEKGVVTVHLLKAPKVLAKSDKMTI